MARAYIREQENDVRIRFLHIVTELSFIGWYLLGAILCGIGALFVNPYKDATMTQLYLELRGPKNYGYTIID